MSRFIKFQPKQRNSVDNSSSGDDNGDDEDNEEKDPTDWMAKLFPTREKTIREVSTFEEQQKKNYQVVVW